MRKIYYDEAVSTDSFYDKIDLPFNFRYPPIISIAAIGTGSFSGIALHAYYSNKEETFGKHIRITGSYTVDPTSRLYGYYLRAEGVV